MATTSSRYTVVTFTGDVVGTQTFYAADNADSAAQQTIQDLASGANTITVPTGGSSVPTAVTIIPPSGNTVLMTLKGVTGDTGVKLHLTDPTTVGLYSTQTTFCLTAASSLVGVRLLWS